MEGIVKWGRIGSDLSSTCTPPNQTNMGIPGGGGRLLPHVLERRVTFYLWEMNARVENIKAKVYVGQFQCILEVSEDVGSGGGGGAGGGGEMVDWVWVVVKVVRMRGWG